MWLVSINKALLYFCAVLFIFKDWQKDNILEYFKDQTQM